MLLTATQVLKVVYVKGYPSPVALDEDDRLDLSPLGLQPASVTIQGIASLVGADGITKRKWSSLLQLLPKPAESAEPLGTAANPLEIAGLGTPVSGLAFAFLLLIKFHSGSSPNEVFNVAGYLRNTYASSYNEARAAGDLRRLHGRYPADLRQPKAPLRTACKLPSGEHKELHVGDQLSLTARQPALIAFIFYAARIFLAMNGGVQDGLLRSTALLGLVGAPGVGKTTFLIQLPYLLRNYLAATNGRQEFMEIGALAGLTKEQAKRFLDAMQNSLVRGKLLVSWIRVDRAIELMPLEKQLMSGQVLALRLLYGCMTYLDEALPDSPFGSYAMFLAAMDPRLPDKLTAKHVHDFLLEVAGVDPDKEHIIFLLCDEANAAKGHFSSEPKASWFQGIVSAWVSWLAENSIKRFTGICALGTSHHSLINISIVTGTKHAQIGLLPLAAPTEAQRVRILLELIERLRASGCPVAKLEWEKLAASPLAALLRSVGGNFRLLSWLLGLLAGSFLPQHTQEWAPETLADNIVKLAQATGPTDFDLRSVLSRLANAVFASSGFMQMSLAAPKLKAAIIQQVVIYALLEEPVQLLAPVPGIPNLPNGDSLQWAHLVETGLVNVVFVDTDLKNRDAVILDEEPPSAEEFGPVTQGQLIASPHQKRPSQHAADSTPQALEPEESASSSWARLRLDLLTVQDTHQQEDQQPHGSTAGVNATDDTARLSPRLRMALLVQESNLAQPAGNPGEAYAVLQMSVLMVNVWWSYSQHLPQHAVMSNAAFYEDASRKEHVDLAALTIPITLRRRALNEDLISIRKLLRGLWVAPQFADQEVKLHPDDSLLGWHSPVKSSRKWEDWAPVVAAAQRAFQPGATRGELIGDVPVARAFTGPENIGCDTVLFVEAPLDLLPILIQSKRKKADGTVTLEFVLQQARSDLQRHNLLGLVEEEDAGVEVPAHAMEQHVARSARLREHQKSRQAAKLSFPSMARFEERVLSEEDDDLLQRWEAYLAARRPALCSCLPWLYVFATDARLTLSQSLRHRILALAGHTLAQRIILVSSTNHRDFYGAHIHTKRIISKLLY